MFYSYSMQGARIYRADLKDAWEDAAETQLRTRKSLNAITVYHGDGSGLIAVQFCWKCGTPTEWQIRSGKTQNCCSICGNSRSLEKIVVNASDSPMMNIAYLFEMRYNQEFTSNGLLAAFWKEQRSDWKQWTLSQCIVWLASLFPPGVMVMQQDLQLMTPAIICDEAKLLTAWLGELRVKEANAEVMNAAASKKMERRKRAQS